MYRIEIPEAAVLHQLDGQEALDDNGAPIPPRPFYAFVDERTCDPLFAGPASEDQSFTVAVLLSAMRCSAAARSESKVAMLEDADYARLRRATDSAAYHPVAGRCFMGHILAVLNATVVK